MLYLFFGLPRYSCNTNISGQKSRNHEICSEHNVFGNSNLVALHLSAIPCKHLLGSLGEGPKLASISRRKAARENGELIAVCLG